MAFSESAKLSIRRKAAFRCSLCHDLGVDIHHIIPQAENGPDSEENAAPLCQNCHDQYGANPQKRKFIRECRDFWFDVVMVKFPTNSTEKEQLGTINELILTVQKEQGSQTGKIEELKQQLERFVHAAGEKVNTNESTATVGSIATQYITATRLSDRVHANFHCKKCGTMIGLLVGSNSCPNCGESIS
ncbi:hypothetical protein A3A71_04240 [Candidatus Berkelbacteria bacterium RIFCSPLOWO2_01_FULL_50_28]|uniref:HNH nuclease domain-containing protein n=1 Tax=Candidatus Berkelbacteria bacterium RIFCSPLOWO2_01_FULL_50_28 TaxID=1797471 RepID=A0A1F5EAH0_9BACT|nr:MAG: hypothetical protein A2807_03370 [Candidatus Berkelbacteria bacterium RIFCSPHIGHO2_01_FULL_50_36]OGD64341.1 MAG: hypothetical protein A3A71_04240 [Candidatus Berkelbacteria bacterium RIFCSPLOWO2_01_FULL_50_28]